MNKLMLFCTAVTLGIMLALYAQHTPEIPHFDSWQVINAFLA